MFQSEFCIATKFALGVFCMHQRNINDLGIESFSLQIEVGGTGTLQEQMTFCL